MIDTLLPPASTPAERALEGATARIGDVPAALRDLWNPATCPAALLPWLGWGLSIDIWDPTWTVAEKRTAIAGCIEAQRRKGTPASIRAVIDRFDPLIELVEWFEDRETMEPHNFRVELALMPETEVEYSEELVLALLRDITAIKPLRSHMQAVFAVRAEARGWLLSAGKLAGMTRLDFAGNTDSAADPFWGTILTTEYGEPILGALGEYLEISNPEWVGLLADEDGWPLTGGADEYLEIDRWPISF